VCFAADVPELLAKESGNVSVERRGDENPAMEVARATFWGAVAGSLVGLAVAAVKSENQSDAIRWGFALGTFAGLATGVYWVTQRPAPASLLELQEGRLVPGPGALAAVEVAPDGMRVRAVAVRF
jgi:hypothetical protein